MQTKTKKLLRLVSSALMFMLIAVSINYRPEVEVTLPQEPREEVLGITAVSWPTTDDWIILTRNGQVITDYEAVAGCTDPTHGSANPSQENDIASQADCSGGGKKWNPGYIDTQFGTVPSIQPDATPENTFSGAIAFRDTNEDSNACNDLDDDYLFFRIRLAADPQTSGKNYLKNNVWFATFDADSDGNVDFYVRLLGSGNNANNDKLAVIHEEAGSSNQVDPGDYIVYEYSNPLGSNHVRRGLTPDNGTVGDTTEYFLDFQVPFELFKDSDNNQILCEGYAITLVNYSTSDNGNDVFKKDKMSDGPSDPVVFANPEYKIEKTAEDLNGGTLVIGDEVEYTLTVTNLASAMSNLEVIDDLQSGSDFVENSYGTGKGIQVEINGTTYNLTNTDDAVTTEDPTCGSNPQACNIKARYSSSGDGKIYFNNTNLYATGAVAPLYDEIIIRYRVTYDEEGTYTNQAYGKTTQLDDKQLSDDPGDNEYEDDDCSASGTNNCNNGVDDDDDPSDVVVMAAPAGGSITVCKMVVDEDDNIVDGSEFSGVTFTIPEADAPSPYTSAGTIPDTDFNLALNLTTDLIDNDQTEDAECVTYDNLPLGDYFYGEETSDGDENDWNTPLYNDQNNRTLQDLGDFFPYSNELFTPGTEDDESRNTNSDGHVVLSEARPDRTIVVLNKMGITEFDLSITKTDYSVTAVPGTSTTYTMVVTNNGPGAVVGATVTDSFPSELTNIEWTCSASAGSECASSGSGNISDFTVDLLAGGTATYTITADIKTDATGTLTNTATVEPPQGSTDSNTANNSATDNTTLTPQTDLVTTKTDNPDPVVAGENVTYTITVTNNGPSNATGVALTDTLPAGLSYVSATTDQGTCDSSVSCALGDLDVGDSANIEIVALVLSSNSAGSVITNNAVATGNETDPDQQNNTDIEDTEVSNVVDLSVTKTDDLTTATPGEATTYTIVVSNSGPSDVDGATVSDLFPASLEDISWTCSATAGSSCNVGPVNGDISDTVYVAAGGSLTYTISATIDSGALGTLSNTVTVTLPDDTSDSNTNNNSATDTTTLSPSADVKVSKMDSPDPVTAGSPLSYTVSVTNDGPSDAASVTVTDTLPAEVTYVLATPTQGSCGQSAGTVTCNLGTIPSGETVNILINVTVNSDVLAGSITNTASAESTTYDPDLSNNNGTTSSESTDVTTLADLSITKTDSPDPVVAGEELAYTLTVQNSGPSDAQDVVITDMLPANTIYQDSLSDVSCDEDSPGIVTCELGTVAAGESISVTIVIVPMTDGETAGTVTITNTATVNSSTTDTNSVNNTDSEDTDVSPSSDLSIDKSASPEPIIAGKDLTYTLTVTNNGPSATDDIIVTDTLPAGTEYVSSTPDSGSCSENLGTVTCDGFANLNREDSLQVIIVVKVPSSTSDDAVLENSATVSSEETPDPNPTNNTDTTITNVDLLTDLAITKTHQEETVIAGEDITYTMTVTNNGPSDATGVRVIDNLPSETTFVSSDAGCTTTAVPGRIRCNLGNIAAGQTVNVTIVAHVSSDVEDGTTIKNRARVSGDQEDTPAGNNRAEDKAVVSTSADISVTKSDTPDPVTAGNNLTYVVAVTNNGPSDAQNVEMTDPLTEEVTFVSVNTTQGICSELDGDISCSLGTIANGQTVNVTIIVNVPASTENGTEIENTATAESEETSDPDKANNDGSSSTISTVVTTEADISITKTDSADPVYAGQQFTYTLTVENTGPSDATFVTVTDTLPGSVAFVSALSDQGTCDESEGIVTCELGTVSAQSSVEISIVVTANEDGEILNIATVSSETQDPNSQDNTAEESTVVDSVADLSITKTDTPDPTRAWADLTYTVVVTNNGLSSANNVVMTDELPASVNFVSVQSSQGVCDHATGIVTCNLGNINYPGTATITIVVTPTLEQTINNTASVTSDVSDDNEENNSVTESTSVQPAPGGGGGGGGNPSTPPPSNEELKLAAPEEIEVQKYCLRYEPDRDLTFTDLHLASRLSPKPMPEETIPLVKKALNILKNSYIDTISIETLAQQVSDIFAFDGRQYVVSGYSERPPVGGTLPATSGKSAFIGPYNIMTRLELAKVMMLSHCYPVMNSLQLTTRYNSNELIHEWDDLPNIDYGDDITNYARDVAYSAQFWWIWDGFWNAGTQRFDTVKIADQVTIAQAIKMNDRLGQLVRNSTRFTEDARSGSWYNTFYANANKELGTVLSPRLLNKMRANENLTRGEAAYELVHVMIGRNLYAQDELQKLIDVFTLDNDEGVVSLVTLAKRMMN